MAQVRFLRGAGLAAIDICHMTAKLARIRNDPGRDKRVSKRDDLIAKYAADLSDKIGIKPDMDLLTKVTIGCGPSIYNADSETVSGTDKTELERVKDSFLVKKLGLPDGPQLMAAIDQVIEKYGRSNRNKYRPVVYYLLTTHFGKQSVYG